MWKPMADVAELASGRTDPVWDLEPASVSPPSASPSLDGISPQIDPTSNRIQAVEPVEPARAATVMQILPVRELDEAPGWAQPDVPAIRPQGRALASKPLAGPWRRFFAQLFDLWTLLIPVVYLLGMLAGRFWPAFALWLFSPGSDLGLGLILIPLSLLSQAVVFGLFGTTLGKLLLGVQVTLIDGGRPNFAEYLGRMVRLYWFGLGSGFPFVTLFTMWRQYGHVKLGRPAGYDVGRFRVVAAPMSGFRTSLAVVAVGALLAGLGYLNKVASDEQRSYFAGFDWSNPVSGKRTTIPRGWVYTEQAGPDGGDPLFVFSSNAAGVIVVFAMEEIGERLTLEQYQRMWVSAVKPQMVMDTRATPVDINGRLGLQMRGVMVNNVSRLVHTTLVKNGGQMWRVVIAGTGGREPDTSATERLRSALFETLPAYVPPPPPVRQENSI